LEAGAQAYVLKGMVRAELVDTIRAVQNGLKRVSSDVAQQLADHVGDDQLSAREIDVVRLMADGNSNRRIAQALGISETTTKSHVQRILGKLQARDRSHAVAIALTRGIIRLSVP
jgi:DNA-binding NarL/FixJ family response regulator